MKLFEAPRAQFLYLIGEDGGGHHAAGFEIVLQPIVQAADPLRHRRAGLLRHARDRLDASGRDDARHDRDVDPRRHDLVAVARQQVVVETELAERARRAGIDFSPEEFKVLRLRA